ncbi:MAG: hypothetical protein A2086_02420 [Spirochaetes bacterium GWD1_27_9]|nr:MAG: hypothetical protein A2Z98_08285 [Spirochaetes bacterium GWB1_27_13]OHD27768.1 MAG: hypothetical protein A2Y34_09015 [Spirochaetes bacterium GWC1_27_15]OHD31585.1 MAG: hypothetical protein A2086_02420 [Spirochaetes bacterium GWD1_27_9]
MKVGLFTIILIILLILINNCSQEQAVNNTSSKTTTTTILSQVGPGTVENTKPEKIDNVIEALNSITLNSDEFAIFYYRADNNYTGWNLWLWTSEIGGSAYEFTGIANSVSYYKAKKEVFFNSKVRTLNLIVRTNAWAKDPGIDQSFNIDTDNKFVVFSGKEIVYPVENEWPRILSAELFENGTANYCVRVKLSGKYGLDISQGNSGFSINNGLTVTDAIAYENRQNISNRYMNFTNDILLFYSGTPSKDVTYTLTHPTFSNSQCVIRFVSLPEKTPDLSDDIIKMLPNPIMEKHTNWIDLYWAAWKFMHEKIMNGDVQKGFETNYIDEGFNENIYQWDSCFMVAYAIYGRDIFPTMATLDNFYNHQSSDGYICRCYNQNTGVQTGSNDVNPPLFAWMEWRYYKLSGDTSRINRVILVLDKYFQWLKNNARSSYSNGLYYNTDFGSGMDNSPRESYISKGAWIDMSSQQALAALYLSKLANVVGNTTLETKYKDEYNTVKNIINSYLWNSQYNTYYDKKEDGTWHIRNTIASFWSMIAEIPDSAQANGMITNHLKNTLEFYRPHLFPTLAANDPLYDKSGHYWQGGVWAPTNFAVIKGLALYDNNFAFEASTNHIENMSKVYHDFNPLTYSYSMPSLTEPNIPRNGDGINQIWEAYSPEFYAPATRWDATLLVRQKFCGWSGVGPVALLIENIIGLDLEAPSNTITWRINFLEKHGIQNIKMGNNVISLVTKERNSYNDKLLIDFSATSSFRLKIYQQNSSNPVYDNTLNSGKDQTITINP